MLFRQSIRRGPDGSVRLALSEDERRLLRQVAEEMRELLHEQPDDRSLRRLFPPAHEDPELEQAYLELTGDQLRSGRKKSLRILEETSGSELLTPDEADAWLRALNDARLVLGTRLDVQEDFDWDEVGPEHPRAQELGLYAYLTWLQEQLCSTM